jgi:hypothetical protein
MTFRVGDITNAALEVVDEMNRNRPMMCTLKNGQRSKIKSGENDASRTCYTRNYYNEALHIHRALWRTRWSRPTGDVISCPFTLQLPEVRHFPACWLLNNIQ